MWLDNASQDAIDLFWRQAGGVEPFPRKLERAVLLALPIAIIKLPRLHTNSIEKWLSNRVRHTLLAAVLVVYEVA